MTPLRRRSENRRRSTRKFNRSSSRTKFANVRQPMRGGWRL